MFDEQNLAEITFDDFSGEGLAACRNPAPAEDRTRKPGPAGRHREAARSPDRPRRHRQLTGAGEIGKKVGEAIGKYKMAKHLDVTTPPPASSPSAVSPDRGLSAYAGGRHLPALIELGACVADSTGASGLDAQKGYNLCQALIETLEEPPVAG